MSTGYPSLLGGEVNDLSHLKVGDVVYITDVNHRPRRTTVAKVGRKYVYAKGDSCGFDIKSGRPNDNYGHSQLVTEAKFNEDTRVLAAFVALRARGIVLEFNMQAHAPEILAILRPFLDTQPGSRPTGNGQKP